MPDPHSPTPRRASGTRLAPAESVGQRSVEILIGRLVTDEDLRQRFIAKPRETIRLAQGSGLQLTAAEVDALLASPVAVWESLAAALDPRLQKASLKRGRSLPEW